MKQITSLQNGTIKHYKELLTKKGRTKYGEYLLQGRRIITDALDNGVLFSALFIDEKEQEQYARQMSLMSEQTEIYLVPRNIIEALSDTRSPEGILACAKISEQPDRPYGNMVVLLDSMQDPGNIGTILRTADAAGIKDIILSEQCVELYNPKLVRSAMGSLFYLNIYRKDLLNEAGLLKKNGYTLVGTALQGENFFTRPNASGKQKTAVIIGNEGNGIRPELLAAADKIYTLPMCGKAESLNAAVAAGILLYNLIFANN